MWSECDRPGLAGAGPAPVVADGDHHHQGPDVVGGGDEAGLRGLEAEPSQH